MAEITRENWTGIALELAEHLEAAGRLARQKGIEIISIGAFSSGKVHAFCIAEDDVHYGIEVYPDGRVEITEDNEVYYTRT